jgi:hypothetical protein
MLIDDSIYPAFACQYSLGGCLRIENLLRNSGFWPIFPIKFVKYNKYSPHLLEKMDSKPFSLATASILGQPPSAMIDSVSTQVIRFSF